MSRRPAPEDTGSCVRTGLEEWSEMEFGSCAVQPSFLHGDALDLLS